MFQEFVLPAVLMGLVAAYSPGPVVALIISETMQYGLRNGLRIAIVPFITDLPLILLVLFLGSAASDFPLLLGLLSIAGGLFLLFLGYQNLRVRMEQMVQVAPATSLMKALVANVLNPYPYLFWIAIGTNVFSQKNQIGSLLFGGVFLTVAASALASIAIFSHAARMYFYRFAPIVVQVLGGLLCLFSILLIRDGIQLIINAL